MSKRISNEAIVNQIYLFRGRSVMVDRDLAALYGVPTSRLNEQVKRNIKRFPDDFMFQLTRRELKIWKSQIATSNSIRKGLRRAPYVFTEQGVAMLSSVLNSQTAIEVNIAIIRVFTRLREIQFSNKEILLKLERIRGAMLRNDHRVTKNEKDILQIFRVIKELLYPQTKPMRKIGFRQGRSLDV
jgi:hypothetical protein